MPVEYNYVIVCKFGQQLCVLKVAKWIYVSITIRTCIDVAILCLCVSASALVIINEDCTRVQTCNYVCEAWMKSFSLEENLKMAREK